MTTDVNWGNFANMKMTFVIHVSEDDQINSFLFVGPEMIFFLSNIGKKKKKIHGYSGESKNWINLLGLLLSMQPTFL